MLSVQTVCLFLKDPRVTFNYPSFMALTFKSTAYNVYKMEDTIQMSNYQGLHTSKAKRLIVKPPYCVE